MLHFQSQLFIIIAKWTSNPREVGSMLRMLVLTGGEQRPLGNCGHDMQRYMTWCPTLVFIALSLPFSSRLISAPYHQTQDSEKISRRLRSCAAQVTSEMPLLTGLDNCLSLSLWVSCLKASSCSDMYSTMFVHLHTGGPTTGPTSINIFVFLMWYVFCVVMQCFASTTESQLNVTQMKVRINFVVTCWEENSSKHHQIASQ